MDQDEVEQLEQLQKALMATRFPVLLVGVMVCLVALLATVIGIVWLGVVTGPGFRLHEALVFGAMYGLVLMALWVFGGSLLRSGVAGLLARGDESKITVVASSQLFFWRLFSTLCVIGFVACTTACCWSGF